MKARIYVTLKEGVLDPAGKAVVGGVHALGYSEVSEVRIGKFFEMELKDSSDGERIREMCGQLLANPVIEDFRIELGNS